MSRWRRALVSTPPWLSPDVPRFAAIDDALLAYDEAGSPAGVPLLYVHGFPHTRRLWRHQLQGLPPLVYGIAMDLRGFGDSRGPAARSMDAHADDLVRLLDHLSIESAVCCGLSMGGYVAFALWRRHPDRVRGLVLADTRMGPDSDEARQKRQAMIEIAEARGAAVVADLLLSGMLGARTAHDHPEIVHEMRELMAAQAPAAIVDALSALRDRVDSSGTLPTVTVPTLAICGTDDTLTPPSEAKAMRDALTAAPSVRLELIERAGHVSCVERPAAFNCVLGEFMADIARAS